MFLPLHCIASGKRKVKCLKLMSQQDSSVKVPGCKSLTRVQFPEPMKRWMKRTGSTKLTSKLHTCIEAYPNPPSSLYNNNK